MQETTKRRILIVQPVVTHYRVPFFDLVQQTDELDIVVAAADRFMGFQSAATFARMAAPIRALPGNRLFWQSVDLSGLRRGDGLIFSGNARFLNLLPDMAQARLRGLRIGWWGHWRSSGGRKKAAEIRRLVSRQADMVLAYCAAERDAAIAAGVPSCMAFTAPNTIDDRKIRRMMAERSHAPSQADGPFPDGRPYFLSIGRLIASKKVDLSIRALAGIDHPSAPGLLIVGDGPERASLQDLASSLGVSTRVRFAGSLTDDEQLQPLFSTALASVSAGPIGLAAPHSLAFHLPVIFVDTHNGPEEHFLVHGRNALRCAQSEDALRSAMSALVGDPELRRQLRDGARESAERDVPIGNMVEGFLAACRYLVRIDSTQDRAGATVASNLGAQSR